MTAPFIVLTSLFSGHLIDRCVLHDRTDYACSP